MRPWDRSWQWIDTTDAGRLRDNDNIMDVVQDFIQNLHLLAGVEKKYILRDYVI